MDYIKINCDLHLHGLYSGAVSSNMIPKVIGEQAPMKGLQLLGTGDILNEKWVKLIKEQLDKIDDGLFEHKNGTKFILQTEIEDNHRVHHIILFPSLSKVKEVKEKLKKNCKNLDTDGRPKVWLNGEEIAEICLDADCLIGFAHAFTPYFGLFSKYDSYKECYGRYWNKVYFLELGLSADTDMADRISELHNLTFTSNSDAHSPWPNKLGREFNTFRVKEISFNEIKKALKRENGRKCVLNVGFNPLEGKYHKTRCRKCLTFYDPKEAIKFNWKCPNCRNFIKKGVDYRVDELADLALGKHPKHRPRYIHIIPLSEIIALALDISNAWSIKVQDLWRKYVNEFGSEIKVLLEVDIDKLSGINVEVSKYIKYFRDKKIKYIPGGAGIFGKLLKPGEEANFKVYGENQRTLDSY